MSVFVNLDARFSDARLYSQYSAVKGRESNLYKFEANLFYMVSSRAAKATD